MMIRQNKAFAALVLCTLSLGGCGTKEVQKLHVSGAKSALSIMHILANQSLQTNRPSGLLGIFSGIYTAQGVFLPVQSAAIGMQAIGTIIMGQTQSTTDENFALLQEIGDVLQVNVLDMLNRSTNRAQSLQEYTQSLKNVGIAAEQKISELSVLNEEQKDQVRDERKAVREIDSAIRDALRAKDYANAAQLEENLAKTNASYAEISTKQDQTNDMIQRFDAVLDIAVERLQAIEMNREILIAGLRVIEVPGIIDFNILEKGKSWRKKKGMSIFDKSTTSL